MYNKKLLIFIVLCFLYAIFYLVPIYNGNTNPLYNNPNKLWAHRVLTISEANKLSNKFNGIELDVFFEEEKNIFDLRHHGGFRGQSLYDFLLKIDSEKLFFWIDLKNINKENINAIINRLDFITSNNNLKNQIIIESKNIAVLSKLKEKDYKISYWLPSFNIITSIINILAIKNNIIKYKPDAISCSYHNIDFYSRKFPNYNLHTWVSGLDSKHKDRIIKIVKKENIKVILIDFRDNIIKDK